MAYACLFELSTHRCSHRLGGGWLYLFAFLMTSTVVSASKYLDDGDRLVVATTKGKVRGITLLSATGKPVDAWLGIPYAEKPIGDLRFRHPKPVKRWDNILTTDKLPNSCVQVTNPVLGSFPGYSQWNLNTPISEDCLYINVVVPKPRPTNAVVMVWIHGGGFFQGSSTLDFYDHKTLVSEENVILVSMQYRVASLGFLYFDEANAPGNAGLFDQLMALNWVRDNIRLFGGNPKNITLFGESAGAASIGLHLISPLSRHVFNQAIMQSGSATSPWATISREGSILRGLHLAAAVGCPSSQDNLSSTVDCLRQRNASDLVYSEWGEILGIAQFPFLPVIDGTFLQETPQESLHNKKFKNANILMGSNANEGYIFLFVYLPQLFKIQEDVLVSRDIFLQLVGANFPTASNEVLQAIVSEYTDWSNPDDPDKNRDALDQIVGDYYFTCSVNEFSTTYAETGNKVYKYYFKHRNVNNPWPSWTGVMHGDEISYVFGQPLNPNMTFLPQEKELSKKMMRYWANFAKTGNPSLNKDGTWTSTYWPRYTAYRKKYIALDVNSTSTGRGLRSKQCAFWEKYRQ